MNWFRFGFCTLQLLLQLGEIDSKNKQTGLDSKLQLIRNWIDKWNWQSYRLQWPNNYVIISLKIQFARVCHCKSTSCFLCGCCCCDRLGNLIDELDTISHSSISNLLPRSMLMFAIPFVPHIFSFILRKHPKWKIYCAGYFERGQAQKWIKAVANVSQKMNYVSRRNRPVDTYKWHFVKCRRPTASATHWK